jgi:hypothetical protein
MQRGLLGLGVLVVGFFLAACSGGVQTSTEGSSASVKVTCHANESGCAAACAHRQHTFFHSPECASNGDTSSHGEEPGACICALSGGDAEPELGDTPDSCAGCRN